MLPIDKKKIIEDVEEILTSVLHDPKIAQQIKPLHMELFGKGSDKSDIQRISDELTGAKVIFKIITKKLKKYKDKIKKITRLKTALNLLIKKKAIIKIITAIIKKIKKITTLKTALNLLIKKKAIINIITAVTKKIKLNFFQCRDKLQVSGSTLSIPLFNAWTNDISIIYLRTCTSVPVRVANNQTHSTK